MRRRGFTLLEILITLALIALVAALSIPSLIRFSDERTFEDGAELILDQLLLARAAAQEMGEPVEVVYRPGSRDIIVRRFQPGADGPQDFQSLDFDDRGGSADGKPVVAASILNEAWTRLALPGTLTLSRQRPVDTESADAVDTLLDDPESDEQSNITIAVFVADGTALQFEELWLVDEDRRLGNLRINPWTGLPRYEREMDRPDSTEVAPNEESDDEPGAATGTTVPTSSGASSTRLSVSGPGTGTDR